ncbi:hypothetical protein HDK77DRAFT_232826 [Phyllosticta capitalensis]|uniref:Uncharacterized protein n=1 Tax=Phyllosticta capitalensis TaxID=121624 RepID=A0ABR1YNL2_9PEZI
MDAVKCTLLAVGVTPFADFRLLLTVANLPFMYLVAAPTPTSLSCQHPTTQVLALPVPDIGLLSTTVIEHFNPGKGGAHRQHCVCLFQRRSSLENCGARLPVTVPKIRQKDANPDWDDSELSFGTSRHEKICHRTSHDPEGGSNPLPCGESGCWEDIGSSRMLTAKMEKNSLGTRFHQPYTSSQTPRRKRLAIA